MAKRDVSETTGRDPESDVEVNLPEFAGFSPEMEAKSMLLMVAKTDVTQDSERVAALEWWAGERGSECFLLSNVIELGVEPLKYRMSKICFTS